MIAVTYRITLEEPVLATALGGEPNSAVSYPFIPGSMIRGLVAGRYLSENPDQDLAKDARALLFDGQTRYLNAYLADDQWNRRLPAPFSWRREKIRQEPEEGDIEDHALLEPDQWRLKIKTPTGVDGFASLHDATVSLASPRRHIAVHTLRDRHAGRPTGAQGTLYRYEALASGERFVGAILVPTQQAARDLQALLPEGYYNLGKAATAGYGRIFLHDVKIVPDWQECDMVTRAFGAGDTFVVTLLSDAILRDENGATHTDLVKALDLRVRPVRAFKKAAPVGGFNRTWGLPLPQSLVLRAGSVLVLRAKADITRDELQRLVTDGIGERRAEGFGRVAVNWQTEPDLTQVKAPQHRLDKPEQLALTEGLERLAQRMATRVRRRELDRALVRAIGHLDIGKAPPNSQLSRVRIIARSALAERDLKRISDLFKPRKPSERDPLREFKTARIAGTRLSNWIIELAGEPTSVWQKLRGVSQAKTLGGVEPEGWLAEEYAVRLIDGVLAKKMAQRRKEGTHGSAS